MSDVRLRGHQAEDDGEGLFSAFEEETMDNSPPPRLREAPRAPVEPEYVSEFEEENEDPAPQPGPRPSRHVASTEVERRLTLARYYNDLDALVLFEGDDSELALKVKEDLHGWVVRQMEELVGVHQPAPTVTSEFSTEEVDVLKRLAARALNGPAPVPPQRQAPAPVTKPASAAKRTMMAPREAPPVPEKGGLKVGEVFTEGERSFKYVKNPDKPGKLVKVEVTRQVAANKPVVAPQRLPMPRGKAEWAISTEAYANRASRTALSGNQLLQKNIVAALNTSGK